MPESSCTYSGENDLYWAHAFSTNAPAPDPRLGAISVAVSRNSIEKPSDACHAMWQWAIHAPGFSNYKSQACQQGVWSVTRRKRCKRVSRWGGRWVVTDLESERQVAVGRKHGSVPASWVADVGRKGVEVKGRGLGTDDPEVVPV